MNPITMSSMRNQMKSELQLHKRLNKPFRKSVDMGKQNKTTVLGLPVRQSHDDSYSTLYSVQYGEILLS